MWTRGSVIWISTTGISQIESLAQDQLRNETGGVLLGYMTGDVVVVQKVIGPGSQATHSPGLFSPDHDYHEHRIAEEYRRSSGVTTYLGDWHSHPSGALRLSRRDKGTLKRIATFQAARLPRPVMMIAAGPPWSIGAWRVRASWLKMAQRLAVRMFSET